MTETAARGGTVRDMTTGAPMARILAFCAPLLLGNLFQQFYNMADAVIVARFIGKSAFSAVGSTGALSFLILGFVQGTCSGFSIPVAQEFGAGDLRCMRKCVANGAYLAAGIGVAVTALTVLFTRRILRLLQTPEDILEYAYQYIFVIFAGIGATMLYNLLSGILRALGDSRTPLYFLLIASVLNVGLDLLFILVFKSGVGGAGLATVLSQLVSGLLCLFYIRRRFPLLRFERGESRPERAVLKRLLRAGLPMGMQFSITAVGSIIIQIAVNRLGSDTVAAITAAAKVQNIVAAPMETMGITMATYCGQNYGAGRIDRVRDGLRKSTAVTLAYCVFAFLLVFFAGKTLALLFLDAGETALLARIHRFLACNGAFYPALALIFVYRNSLQGLGFSGAAMFAGLFELFGRAAVAFLLVGSYGFSAVCFANPVAWVCADALLLPLYVHEIRCLSRRHEAERRLLRAQAG